MYKIIASDLDGTLFNSETKISEENIEAIKKLTKMGVYFVPSSGRTLSEVPGSVKNNPDIRYIIHSNGATVHDKVTGENILMCISKEEAKELLDILYSYETHITLRQGGRCLIDADFQKEEDYKYYNVWKLHEEVITEYGERIKNFRKFIYSLDNVEVVSAFFHDSDELEECREKLLKTGFLRVAEGWKNNLEICSVKAGKGKALLHLADKLNINHEDTIAVGDSDNDTTMIKAAGLGLAVSNACDILKENADEIICSNEKHAISYILSHFF